MTILVIILFKNTLNFFKLLFKGENICKQGSNSSSTWYKLSFEPRLVSCVYVDLSKKCIDTFRGVMVQLKAHSILMKN